MHEEDDDMDANSLASSTGVASPTPRVKVAEAEGAHNLDVIQKLDMISIDFATKIEGVLNAIQDVKRDVRDFSGRMDEAEARISNVEDTVDAEKGKTAALVKQVTVIENKLDDLENQLRRSNLRLVNMPEKVETNDAVTFLEKWLPEALGPDTFPSPLIIERAYRLPSRSQPNRAATPRVLIVKFLKFQDKNRAIRASRAKGKILCGGHEVMFFPDISTELHRRRRCFDGVKQQLRALNIRYGIVYPAKLRVTIDGQTKEFLSSAEAEKFVQKIQRTKDSQSN